MRLIIGMSGASGVIYGIRLLEVLSQVEQVETHLVLSNSAKLNIAIETDRNSKEVQDLADEVYSNKDIAARLASGSFKTDGMIVAPCAVKTLSAIANSYADSLLVRAADVVLKERRRLVLVPRETPLHTGHCELLLKASQMGAILAPPMPAHYTNPQTVDDLVDHHVGRLLDLFDLDSGLVQRWQGPASKQS
ncbi:MAG: UbiX family flavin prenyltransferase [Pseudomonadota bacterium]|nr:UbiX family flavin prenyltransferase [Gammaproteobacteria bacterium]MEC7079638.1 UbiX family flavin prenyltransferase [Pseudomonadota bacterium]MEC7127031.1 UbiX family flavin prenyltransferase [Pseudomonadota bacterium]MEC7460376.1 UbiX family flavin prenyltransferase [Pseudomonadota bacterium]MEC7581751.1 UbiX family flavin prenyltransferase [Pseudomonadota bacterium]